MLTLLTKNYQTFSIHSSDGTCIETLTTSQRVSRCLPGDQVILNPATNCYQVKERAVYPLLAGRLELTSKTKYGMTKKGHPMYLFLPFRKEFPPFIVGCSEKKPTKNRLVVITFESWLDSAHLPRGSIQQMLGTCGDFEAEKKALLLTYSPWKYPTNSTFLPDISRESIPKGVIPKESNPKESTPKESTPKESTPLYTFSIDPPGCCDVDDALSIDIKDDCTELWINIADVASVVGAGSTLDEYASKISQTTYHQGHVVRPMLPLEYSHDLCSLLQCRVRPGLSLILTFRQGLLTEKRWARTHILNTQQYTYENFLEEGTLDGIPIHALKECLATLGSCSNDIHTWVEIAMLTYNKEAAALLRAHGTGILRRHAGADDERWAAYEMMKPGLGRLAESSAQYCLADDDIIIHKGLGEDVYCHASSPIRRYADLINQRAIHAILDSKQLPCVSWKDLYHMNLRQKDTKHYERDMEFLEIVEDSVDGSKPTLTALILDVKQQDSLIDTWKYSLWIEEWERLVSWKTTTLYKAGQTLKLEYFINMENRFWKHRIVFRVTLPTNYTNKEFLEHTVEIQNSHLPDVQ